jgi:hypothetical protein
MLSIRREQVSAFERIDPPAFEDEMLEHIREHFPTHWNVLKQDARLRVIRLGHEAAQEYHFATRHEVCLFIDLRMMLGSGFDTDPQLPWAAQMLHDPGISDPTSRIDRLYESAMVYLDHVVGEKEVFPVEPLRSMFGYPADELGQRLSADFEQGMMQEFRRIWTAKSEEAGPESLGRLVSQGINSAQKYGFNSRRDVGFYLLLAFLLGHRVDDDPLHPWSSSVLTDPSLKDGSDRFDRLYGTGQAILRQALGKPE